MKKNLFWLKCISVQGEPFEFGMIQLLRRALKPFVQHTVQAARVGELSARELANIAYGAARVGRVLRLSTLFAALTLAIFAEGRAGDFNPQELANTA